MKRSHQSFTLALSLLAISLAGFVYWSGDADGAREARLMTASSTPASSSGSPHAAIVHVGTGKHAQLESASARMNPPKPAEPMPRSAEAMEADYDVLNTNPEYPDLQYRALELNARRAGALAMSPEEILTRLAQREAWAYRDEPAPDLELTNDERYDGRAFLQVDTRKIESLMPGDQLDIPIHPLQKTFTMIFERVEVQPENDVTWYGHLTEFEAANQVSITRGKIMTAIGITTPDEHFTLQAWGESGWIVSSNTLFKRDPDQTDAVLPEDAHDPLTNTL